MRRATLLLTFFILFPLTSYAQDEHYTPDHRLAEGTETILLYVDSYTCGPCQRPAFKQALEQAKVELAERAEENGESFAAVGISTGWDVKKGMQFLGASGRFDEYIIGRNWLNSAVVQHGWRSEAEITALPTIVVYQQDVTLGEEGVTVSAPTYLMSKKGSKTIAAWVQSGTPLPDHGQPKK